MAAAQAHAGSGALPRGREAEHLSRTETKQTLPSGSLGTLLEGAVDHAGNFILSSLQEHSRAVSDMHFKVIMWEDYWQLCGERNED